MMPPESLAQRQGRAFHALMEAWRLLDQDAELPPVAMAARPVWRALLMSFSLSVDEQMEVLARAQALVKQGALRTLLGLPPPGESLSAASSQLYLEREWLHADGRWLRPDWVWVQAGQGVRVVDWKWAVLTSEQADYGHQLGDYAALMARHFPGHPVEALIITSLGEVWRLEGQGLVHCQSAGRPAL